MKAVQKIEESALWREVTNIAEKCFASIHHYPEEEKWVIAYKLRTRAFDATADITEAIGATEPRDKKDRLGLARADLFGVKNALSLSFKLGYIEADPELMVAIDKIVQEIDSEIETANAEIAELLKDTGDQIKEKKS